MCYTLCLWEDRFYQPCALGCIILDAEIDVVCVSDGPDEDDECDEEE